jgi:hypothetical protein
MLHGRHFCRSGVRLYSTSHGDNGVLPLRQSNRSVYSYSVSYLAQWPYTWLICKCYITESDHVIYTLALAIEDLQVWIRSQVQLDPMLHERSQCLDLVVHLNESRP